MSEIPKNSVITNSFGPGYKVSNEEIKQNIYKNESHIFPNQNALTGVEAEAYEIGNALITYFPKGFKGSKNSDFHEFLSLGKIPYIIGSIMLIALYKGASSIYNDKSGFAANNVAKKMGAGVVLYGIGKWLTKKIAHAGIKASTGVNLDLRYKNIVNELPENGKSGMKRIQYRKVHASRDWERSDLLALDSKLNHNNNMYYYEDQLAKKAGFKEDLNAPQYMRYKVKELITRSIALENITQYIAAATGVALGSQDAFEHIKGISLKDMSLKSFKNNAKQTFKNIKNNLSYTKIKKAFLNEKNAYKPEHFNHNFDVIKDAKGIKEKLKALGGQISVSKNNAKELFNSTNLGAATRVAFSGIKNHKKGIVLNTLSVIKDAFKELWNGTDRNALTKNYGKVLILGTIASTMLTWLIPVLGFKKHPNTMKSKVDANKGYEV